PIHNQVFLKTHQVLARTQQRKRHARVPAHIFDLLPCSQIMREALRQWRRSRPLDIFERARRKFNDAGIEIYSCMYNFTDDLSDDELEFPFDVAKTLGTTIISANCTQASIKRAAVAADRHKVWVAAHSENASFDRNPDGMAYDKNLVAALKHSPY